MDKARKISKDYADQHTCYANDPSLQYLYTRKAVEFGYRQAEKDNELTWEDMRKIVLLYERLLNDKNVQTLPIKDAYTELLKRFKDYKERKEK